jgi:decaheme cytochrome c component MtrC/MtrF-like protein
MTSHSDRSVRVRRTTGAAWTALAWVVAVALVAATAFAVPTTIRLGDTCVGSIEAGQTSFPFYGVAGADVSLTLKTSSTLACDVVVYDPSGAAVPSTSTRNAMRDRLTVRATLAVSGTHTILLDSNATTGDYKLRTKARVPTTLEFDGDADQGVEQWFTFDAFAGTRVASILVRRVDRTLSFPQAGVLEDPSGAPVALTRRKTSAAGITAAKAVLATDGTYTFRFTPAGTGQWTASVKLIGPTMTGTTLQVPVGTIQLARTGIGVRIGVSRPTNGAEFGVGDKAWIGVVLDDDAGNPLSLAQLSTCNLYLYGPQDPLQTVTATALLRAETDRNKRPHHYIDLKTNPDVVTYGNVLLYPLSAVASEAPGTYTAAVWAVVAADTKQQWFPVADMQIRTASVETQVVEKQSCAACHLGTVSGKYYLHHIDPSSFAPNGNVAIDQWPTRTCKSCHNNAGYAAYDNKAGGTDANVNRSPDTIVRRVHGVHLGAGNESTVPGVGFPGLENPFDNDPLTGDFKDYVDVVFPYDVRKCDKCHVDDRWKTAPSRMACCGCHDAVWFGDQSAVPSGYEQHGPSGTGGRRDDDSQCTQCHPATGGIAGVADKHGLGPTSPWVLNTVDLSMTPPLNGSYYSAADDATGVKITLAIRTDANTPGTAIDHTLVTDANFSTANLFVCGPRARTVPALTNAALNGDTRKRATTTNSIAATGSPAGWTFAGTETFQLAINGGAPFTLTAPAGFVTPSGVAAWLNAGFTANGAAAVAAVSGGTKVSITSTVQNWQGSEIDIWNGPVTTAMGWKPPAVNAGTAGTTMEPYVKVGASSYPNNNLRQVLSQNPLDWYDPDVVRTTANMTYTLRGKFADLVPGTYVVYFYCLPLAGKVAGFANKCGMGFMTFQVGTATPEKKVATNCADCHGTTIWHLYEGPIHPQPFDTDYCKACHDYSHYEKGDAFVNQGGTSTNGWSGFGAVPISRRVHGVHRGAYLEHPEEIYSNANPFGEIVFPQDIRNCTKCHAETDTWKQNPSRVACMGCHDSDAAKSHGALMTLMTQAMDPYGAGAQESCAVCHGENAEFAVAKVHALTSPYVPPYPREEK